MKKILALLLVLVMVLTFAACGKKEVTGMTHEEYAAAAMDTEVSIVTYVQNHQSWWEKDGVGVITVYCQSPDGAYFLYELKCSEEDAAKLTPGTKIAVTGFKGEWAGEVEVMDGTFTFVEGGDTFVAEALDVTAMLGTDELIAHQNEFVAFNGMTVEAANEEGSAFQYNWDGSGEEGSDLYFKASVGGNTYTFVVESYLTGPGSDVYEAVKALTVGQTVNLEGFLYWYEGVQPHITNVTVAE